MTEKQRRDREKMVACMEFIARHINDEEIFLDNWLRHGVADGDIPYGNLTPDIEDYYIKGDVFKDLMTTFLDCMSDAYKSGGLYCGGVVSE